MGTKGNFKKVGANILKPSSPKSMAEFITTSDAEPEAQAGDGQMHNCTVAHLYNESPKDERLHVFINGDLADSLADEVHRRKKIRDYDKNNASKRGVVEDALSMYFERYR